VCIDAPPCKIYAVYKYGVSYREGCVCLSWVTTAVGKRDTMESAPAGSDGSAG
jgi:hypothetical protein